MGTLKITFGVKNPGPTPLLDLQHHFPAGGIVNSRSFIKGFMRIWWNLKFKPVWHLFQLNFSQWIWTAVTELLNKGLRSKMERGFFGWFIYFSFLPPLDPTFAALVFQPTGSAGWFHHPAMKQRWRFLISLHSSHLITFYLPFLEKKGE